MPVNGKFSTASVILGARLRDGDAAAFKELGAAVEGAEGNLKQACRDMGIPYRTVANWRHSIEGVEDAIGKARDAAGWERCRGD